MAFGGAGLAAPLDGALMALDLNGGEMIPLTDIYIVVPNFSACCGARLVPLGDRSVCHAYYDDELVFDGLVSQYRCEGCGGIWFEAVR